MGCIHTAFTKWKIRRYLKRQRLKEQKECPPVVPLPQPHEWPINLALPGEEKKKSWQKRSVYVCAGKLSGLTLARLWNTDSDMAVPRSMQQKVENWTEKIFRRADRLETMMSVLSSVDFDFRVLRRKFEGTDESIVIIIVSRKTDQYLSLGVLKDTGDRFMEMFQRLSKGQQEDIFISATEDSFLGHCKGIFEDVFAREREGGGAPAPAKASSATAAAHKAATAPQLQNKDFPSDSQRASEIGEEVWGREDAHEEPHDQDGRKAKSASKTGASDGEAIQEGEKPGA